MLPYLATASLTLAFKVMLLSFIYWWPKFYKLRDRLFELITEDKPDLYLLLFANIEFDDGPLLLGAPLGILTWDELLLLFFDA